MKIGAKEFTPIYTNRTIYEIEEAFDNKPYHKIMTELADATTKQLGVIIWHGIKDKMDWDEFVNTIELNQYESASIECGEVMAKAFTVKKK